VGTKALREISEATPTSRDRYVDFLRAASIGMVVLGVYLGTLIVMTEDDTQNGNNGPDHVSNTFRVPTVVVASLLSTLHTYSNLDHVTG